MFGYQYSDLRKFANVIQLAVRWLWLSDRTVNNNAVTPSLVVATYFAIAASFTVKWSVGFLNPLIRGPCGYYVDGRCGDPTNGIAGFAS
jgi:hypothetical protein